MKTTKNGALGTLRILGVATVLAAIALITAPTFGDALQDAQMGAAGATLADADTPTGKAGRIVVTKHGPRRRYVAGQDRSADATLASSDTPTGKTGRIVVTKHGPRRRCGASAKPADGYRASSETGRIVVTKHGPRRR
jgi:hypothetical protein